MSTVVLAGIGPGIIIPILLLVIVVPVGFVWAKKTFKDPRPVDGASDHSGAAVRLTSAALRDLRTPTWRVVYEIAADKLGGIEHVLIGPPGAFALTTSLDPLPADLDPAAATDAAAMARAAITRGELDTALARCALSSAGLVAVHWGVNPGGTPAARPGVHGTRVVDGRRLGEWVDGLPATLTEAQVDLAWQTVCVAIGRPDPLA